MKRALSLALALCLAALPAHAQQGTPNFVTVTATTAIFPTLKTTANGGSVALQSQAGNTVALFLDSANGAASNYLRIANAATGSGPVVRAFGTDANVSITYTPLGTGINVLNNGLTVNSNVANAPFLGNIGSPVTFNTGVDSAVNHSPSANYWINSTGNVGQISWLANTAYTVNTQRNNGGNIYKVTTAGTSAGSGGPTGTGTGIADNTIVWDYVSSDFTGNKWAVAGNIGVRSHTGPTASGQDNQWGAGAFTFTGSANQGGTDPSSPNTSIGIGYGLGVQTWLFSGATAWQSAGNEFDVGIFTGATAANRFGLNLSSFGNLQASVTDAALTFTSGGSGTHTGWGTIFNLGWGVLNGTAAIMQYAPSAFAPFINTSVNRGLDLYNVSFTSDIVLRAAGNTVINDNGSIASGAASLSTSSSAVSLDAPGSIVTAVPSIDGGAPVPAACAVGDQVWETDGAGTILTVNTVDGGGKPLTWTLTRAGGVLGATPSNPVAFAGAACVSLRFNLTWTRIDTLALNPSGGNTVVGTGSALATNATSGFLQVATMAGAPTGNCGGAAGKACLVVDTTNKKICYSFTGTTWECTGALTP